MWKKIAIIQMIIIVALVAFWIGTDTRAAEPLRREFVTQNTDGHMIYIWAYQQDKLKPHWNVTRLDFSTGSKDEKDISVRW